MLFCCKTMEVPKETCGICGEIGANLMPNLKTLKTKYSGTCVFDLLERLLKCELLEAGSNMADYPACDECSAKVNDYDAAYTKALIIQKELLDLMKQSPLGFVMDFDTLDFGKDEEEENSDSPLLEAEEHLLEAAETKSEFDEQPVDDEPGQSDLSKEICWKCNACGKQFKKLSEMKTHKHFKDEIHSEEEIWDVSDLPVESLHPPPQVIVEESEDNSQHSAERGMDAPAENADSDEYVIEEIDVVAGESGAESPVDLQHVNECYYCDEYFTSKASFKQHMEKQHSLLNGEHKCKTCGFTAKTRAALCNHFARHSRPPVACPICNREFQQAGSLQRHMVIHSREPLFHCDQCGKEYVHYSSFYMHQLAHKDIRLQKCKICGFELRSTSHLKRHMRTHSGEKPFTCPECGQRFSQRYNMKSHLNGHRGITRKTIKSFVCLLCQKVCSRKMSLRQHLQVVHGLSDEAEIEQALLIQTF